MLELIGEHLIHFECDNIIEALAKLSRCMARNIVADNWIINDPRFVRLQSTVKFKMATLTTEQLGKVAYWLGMIGVVDPSLIQALHTEIGLKP